MRRGTRAPTLRWKSAGRTAPGEPTSWHPTPAAPAEFLGWAFNGRDDSYRPRVCVRDGLATVWTAPRYIQAFDEHLAELERQAEQSRHIQEAYRAAARRQAQERHEGARRKNAL